jgi:hypothetical protein
MTSLWQRLIAALGRLGDLLSDLHQVMGPSRYSILIVGAGGFAFLFVPQGQDVLRRVGEWGDGGGRAPIPYASIVVFLLAVLVWALSSWYWARVSLYLREEGGPPDTPRQAWLRVWVPRLLGVGALAAVGLGLVRAALSYAHFRDREPALRLSILAAICFAEAALFLYFCTHRRQWMRALRRMAGVGEEAKRADHPAAQFTMSEGLPRGTRRAVLAVVALAVVLCLWFTLAPIRAGHFFETVPIVMLAGAVVELIGTGILYLSRRLRFPVLLVLVLLTVVFSFWNDNHAIGLAPPGGPPKAPGSIAKTFQAWLGGLDDGPIFLATAEGGGIRAAYWTSLVLATIQDRDPSFGRHLFAVSGVSGGSVGAGVFTALVAEQPAPGAPLRCGTLAACSQRILGEDFLSPTLAKMVGPDLVQRFLPFRCALCDRGRTLEDAWARGWQDAVGSRRLDQPFLSLWRGRGPEVPALVLNGTHVETGRRMITTNLAWQRDEIVDSYDLPTILGADLPLKGALHNSARFTYVSPAGSLRTREGKLRGHVVDGGYFENSGVATVLDLLHVIQGVCPTCAGRIHVLILTNSPEMDPNRKVDRASPEAGPKPDEKTVLKSTEPPKKPAAKPAGGLNELLSPPLALLNTRGARGSQAVAALKLQADGPKPPLFFHELGLCDRGFTGEGRETAMLPLPLGWLLSRNAQQAMDEQLKPSACPGLNNQKTLDEIHALLQAGAPAGAAAGPVPPKPKP